MKIKLSKSQWELTGEKAGWVNKKANSQMSLSLDIYSDKNVFRLNVGVNGALLKDCDEYEIWTALGRPPLIVRDYRNDMPKTYKGPEAVNFMKWN